MHRRLLASYNADGSLNVIYDPTKTYTDATGVHRTPFPGNKIQVGQLSTVGRNIASYYPLPQLSTPTGQYNFTGTDDVRDHAQEVTVKLDQQIRTWWNVSGSYIFYEALQPLGNPLGTLPGSYSYTYHRQVDATQINSTWILNPKTVITARYGNNRFPNLIAEVSQGFDPATLGFPTSYTSQIQSNFFPTIFLRNFSQLGQNTSSLDNWKSQIVNGTLARTEGRHNLTFGAEYRRIRMNFQDFSNAPGTYTFSGAFTQSGPNATGDGSGSDLADLLLGYPIMGEVDITTPLKTYLDYSAVFAQDDWRVSSRLTLNLGLRYEAETGLKENNNQLAVGFDRTATSQLSDGVTVTGGILFAGVNGNRRDVGDLSLLKFAPRLGASYQLTPKTVIRGGYGILYAPLRYDPIGTLAPGYDAANSYIASFNNNQTPAGSLDNPFPNGLQKPAGNSAGLLTGLGNSVTSYDQNLHAPRIQQFSVGVERELPGHIALDASYIGSRSINLNPSPTSSTPINIDQLNPSNFSLGGALGDQVPNPDYVAEGPGITGQTSVSRSQTLLPFPQFTSVNLFVSSAHADYNALLVKAEKRAGHGLNLITSFTWSRNMDSSFATANSIQSPGVSAPQNVYDLEAEYAHSVTDVPYRFIAGALYDLPFGQGERFSSGTRWGDEIIGRWQLNILPTFQSGFPVSIYQSSNPNSTIAGNGVQRPNLVSGASLETKGSLYDRLNGYINPAAFTASSAYTFGNAPRTLSLRGPGYENWDISLQECPDSRPGECPVPCPDVQHIQYSAIRRPKYGLWKRKLRRHHVSGQLPTLPPTWSPHHLLTSWVASEIAPGSAWQRNEQMSSNLSRRSLLKTSGFAMGAALMPLSAYAGLDPQKLIHLNLNENAFGPSENVQVAIQRELSRISRYADATAARAFSEQIAAYERVPVEQVVLGEILGALGLYLGSQGGPGGEFIYSTPGYLALVDAASHVGGIGVPVPLNARYENDLPGLVAKINTRTRALYLINPHNPTGTVSADEPFKHFLREVSQHTSVIVDEAYLEYTAEFESRSAVSLVREGANVLVFRTFDKIHGLAGLPIGYTLAPRRLAAALRAQGVGDAESLGRLNIVAASAALADTAHVERTRSRTATERAKWISVLDELKLQHTDTKTNFIFFNAGHPQSELAAAFRARNIDIGRTFPPYLTWARITIGLPEENENAQQQLRKVLNDLSNQRR